MNHTWKLFSYISGGILKISFWNHVSWLLSTHFTSFKFYRSSWISQNPEPLIQIYNLYRLVNFSCEMSPPYTNFKFLWSGDAYLLVRLLTFQPIKLQKLEWTIYSFRLFIQNRKYMWVLPSLYISISIDYYTTIPFYPKSKGVNSGILYMHVWP